jgi:hypothetical protein
MSDGGSGEAYRGAESARDNTTDHNALHFLSERVLGRASTATLVKIVKVTNAPGDLKAVGRVDVKPLVNQVDGRGQSVEHKTVFGLAYFRYGGSTNAVLLDPEPGDVGLAIFADRDISGVKRTRKESNPGSRRRFDMSDGIYVGLVLTEGAPKQYVRFTADGIDVTDKNANQVLLDKDGVKVTGPGGNKIKITSDGIDLN